MSRRPSPHDPHPSASETAARTIDEPFADDRSDGGQSESREEPFAGATLGTVLGGIAGGVVGGPAGAVAGGALGAAGGAAVGDGARHAADEAKSGDGRRARRRRRPRPRRARRIQVQAALASAELDAPQAVPPSSESTPLDVADPSGHRGG